MFYRANEKANGSGLGLYIAEINVASTVGEFTQFNVILPNLRS